MGRGMAGRGGRERVSLPKSRVFVCPSRRYRCPKKALMSPRSSLSVQEPVLFKNFEMSYFKHNYKISPIRAYLFFVNSDYYRYHKSATFYFIPEATDSPADR